MKNKEQQMKEAIKRNFFSRPLLEIYINIPFLLVRTSIAREAVEMYITEYLYIQVKIFKWETKFRLYQTGLRRNKNE